MKVIGVVGWSGSGKTTLLVRLIPVLTARGLTVSTIKHAHHGFDVDQPGKDSYEHRAAGATEVLVSSARRWALMHELRGAPEPGLDELVARMTPVDLLIVEGFKGHPHDKIEVHRATVGKPLLCASDPYVVAVATDAAIAETHGRPRLDLNDVGQIADFIVAHCRLRPAHAAAGP
ncbi:MAG TPA: molybdopterin-guanine dinucleotide biosynthesis protein B [Alphaproteobacteria bacterium]